ncbi:hypothetical protein [Thermococcus thermotolerans]|uniref:hypothetical protein n=1 Tax=Thermococcus thermotolerans TaxID=2969672 RepID=UPI0021579023|nr:hypothetical protein [Thermococcus thermotolerans]
MVPSKYIIGIGYGISLWLITSGLILYFKTPKTFSFVIRESDLEVVPKNELPDEVREYKRRLEESLRQKLIEKSRKEARNRLLAGVFLLVATVLFNLFGGVP